MTQIIAAIVGAVVLVGAMVLVVLCGCCYALGKSEGELQGLSEAYDMLLQCMREAKKADDEADI